MNCGLQLNIKNHTKESKILTSDCKKLIWLLISTYVYTGCLIIVLTEFVDMSGLNWTKSHFTIFAINQVSTRY